MDPSLIGSPQGKVFAIAEEQLQELVQGDLSSAGCTATGRIVVDGSKVGYMYREDPGFIPGDCGWRFFSGDEEEAYISNGENTGIYTVNIDPIRWLITIMTLFRT